MGGFGSSLVGRGLVAAAFALSGGIAAAQNASPTLTPAEPDSRRVTLLAESSLAPALELARKDLEIELGCFVQLRYGRGDLAAERLMAGEAIPADAVAFADTRPIDVIAEQSLVAAKTRRVFGSTTLVVAQGQTRSGSINVEFGNGAWPTAAIVALRFARESARSFVIVDPDQALEGVHAKRALESADLWDDAQAVLRLMDDSIEAARALADGDAAFGLIYASTARLSPRMRLIAAPPPEAGGRAIFESAALNPGECAVALARSMYGRTMTYALQRAGVTVGEPVMTVGEAINDILSDPTLSLFEEGDPGGRR